ncbi:MAG: preprotein translocase subunit SecA [Candidatus Paceibacterota bacterium]|jgi:preprotein translocase subunit SecA
MAFSLKKLFGTESDRLLKPFNLIVPLVNSFEPAAKALTDEALSAKTGEFRARLEKGESLDDILPEAYAVVREASRRTLGERHYEVQFLGGIAMHKGYIAEMRTGEGKTLVATLPAYLNALSGKGVHIVTVNDYLSRRDGTWMGQIYSFLGLSVGVINHESSFLYDPKHKEADEERDELGSFKVFHEFLRPSSRREAYEADITYGTNNEFGFDYLRDHLVYEPGSLVQRNYHYAIVDEIDSILIDEARTPLIISAQSSESEDLYRTFASLAGRMNKEEDYLVDEKEKAIRMTDAGIDKAEKALGVDNIYTERGVKMVHHLETAVRAKALFSRDKEYVVKDGEIIIVDEFTGRLQPGRRWSEGLHQAIEAKEGVTIEKESRTYASISFQNYFRLYEKLSGMTGTALTSSEEFFKVYRLEVVAMPTNREIKRIDHNDFIFQSESGKFKAIAKKVKELYDKGQPVLIGTVSIEKNEILSEYFKLEGIPHKMLNAKNHENEGEIIAQAGRKSSVVIATNMAGRGVDIKLGGNPHTQDEYEKVKSLGGLFVLGTERHEARRIDNQLRGRAGRQGDPGETQFFVSLEDSLMRIFAPDNIKKLMGRLGIPEDQPIENGMISKALESAQEKIEGFNFDRRKHLLEYDDVMNHQRKITYERRQKALAGDRGYLEILVDETVLGDEELTLSVENKRKEFGDDAFFREFRKWVIQAIDMLWVEHLEAMDYLRDSVGLRAVGQRDPLVEYKKDGLRMFKEMEESLYTMLARMIPQMNISAALPVENTKFQEIHEEVSVLGGSSAGAAASHEPVKAEAGRNDPCPCGAKKADGTPIKYKHCHGK